MKHEITPLKPVAKTEALTALLKHQDAIQHIDGMIKSLESLIEYKRDQISQIESSVPKIDHLNREREDILALMAMGNKTDADLAEFDESCAKIKESHRSTKNDAEVAINEARSAVAGIERKLEETKNLRRGLQSNDQKQILDFLMGKAEEACDQYVKAAYLVKEQYLRVIAIDRMLKKNSSNGLFYTSPRINLPIFNLASCNGLAMDARDGIMFSEFFAYVNEPNSLATQAFESLVNEFQSAGLAAFWRS